MSVLSDSIIQNLDKSDDSSIFSDEELGSDEASSNEHETNSSFKTTPTSSGMNVNNLRGTLFHSEPPIPTKRNDVQAKLAEILSVVQQTNLRIAEYDGKITKIEEKLVQLENIASQTSSTGSELEHEKRKVPNHVRQLVRDLYKSLTEEDENFLGFDVKKKYSEKENQSVVKKIVEEIKGQDPTIPPIQIKGATRRFFLSKSADVSIKEKGLYGAKVQKQRRRNRITKKLEMRKATIEKTSALPEDKKKQWREVLTLSFMSSEESGEDPMNSSSVLFVKYLPWRSAHVSKFFKQIDQKANKKKTKKGRQQTIPRIQGGISNRTKPITEFGNSHWAFAS